MLLWLIGLLLLDVARREIVLKLACRQLVVDVVSYWLAHSDVQLFMVNQIVRIIRSVIYGFSVMLHA